MSAPSIRPSLLLGLTALMLVSGFGRAEVAAADNSYPNRPVRIVIPFSAGGSTDILARPIAAKLQNLLGQPFIIENRGGAGGNIGAEAVARDKGDGYTIMITTSGVIDVNGSLYRKLSYSPEKDFAPISVIASLPNILVVSENSPFNSVQDIINKARSEPGHVTFGSGGIGTSNHLAGELLKYVEKIDMTHVPYRGGGPASLAVLSGEVSMLFATIPTAIQQVRAGKLKAFAVTSAKRSSAAPDIPTMEEAGVKNFAMEIWIGALAPKDTPPEIVQKLNAGIAEALKDPEVVSVLKNEGYEPIASTPEAMAVRIKEETAMWKKVIETSNIHVD